MTATQYLVEQLLKSDNSHDAKSLLVRAGYWEDETLWMPYGGTESNIGIISSQQADPVAALVEKIVNGIDAVLMLHCRLKGVDPQSVYAAANMQEAVKEYLGWDIPTPKVENNRELHARSHHMSLVFSGNTGSPTIDMIDRGEGQNPEDFHRTFVSLNQIRKSKIPFVQGKYNMGSTGVLNFLGGVALQMIISRRHPDLDGHSWGMTIVRCRFVKEKNQSLWEYLAPGGEVLSWNQSGIPIIPSGRRGDSEQFSESIEHGSVIRLWDYEGGPVSVIRKAGAWRHKLDALLPQITIPVHMWDYRTELHSGDQTTISRLLVGAYNRSFSLRELVHPDGSVSSTISTPIWIYVDGYPIFVEVHYPVVASEDGRIEEVWVFSGKDRLESQAGYGPIFYIINGQSHSYEDATFFNQKDVNHLRDLQYGLMVYADLTEMVERGMSHKEVEDLFMASRDRFRKTDLSKKIKSEVAKALGSNQELKNLAHLARIQKHRASKEQSEESKKEWADLMKRIQPTGKGQFTRDNPQDLPEIQQTKRFPNDWKLVKPRKTRKDPVPIHQYTQNTVPVVEFESDAEFEYFTRAEEPGSIEVFRIDQETGEVTPDTHLIRKQNGRFRLSLPSLQILEIDQTVHCKSVVTDPQRDRLREPPWIHEWIVEPKLRGSKPSNGNGGHKPKPPVQATLFPEVRLVDKDQWDDHGFDEYSGATLTVSEEGNTVVFVNMDNSYLLHAVRSVYNDDIRANVRDFYATAMAANAVVLWEYFTNVDDSIDEKKDPVEETTLFCRINARSTAEVALQTARKLNK